MPIILDKHTVEDAHILIWKDEENVDFFLQQTKLNENDKKKLEQYTAERRKKDLLISRYLLQKIIPSAEILYHPNGKPYLKNKEAQISISHSKDLVAIIIHEKQTVGIDIEYISPRVERVKERFLSTEELQHANTTELLTLYWSAKETLFKLDEKQGLDFKTQISISPDSATTLIGNICNGNDIPIHYLQQKNWVLTFAIVKN